jgi:murein hydrolase activator
VTATPDRLAGHHHPSIFPNRYPRRWFTRPTGRRWFTRPTGRRWFTRPTGQGWFTRPTGRRWLAGAWLLCLAVLSPALLLVAPSTGAAACTTPTAAAECAVRAAEDPAVIGLSRVARALLAARTQPRPELDPATTIAYRRTVRVLATLAAANGPSPSPGSGADALAPPEDAAAALHPDSPAVTALLLPPPLPPRDRAAPPPGAAEDARRFAPVDGRIIQRFGARLPDGGVRRGIAYQAKAGEVVRAPASGRIAFAGPFRGYGLLLIVEHAGGYHSLLTGLGRIDTHIDEAVRAGDPIAAAAGAKGGAPRVYLELRRGGRPVDPMPWLASAN